MGEHAGAGRGDGLEHRGRRLEGRLRGEVPAGLHPQADHEQVEWRLSAGGAPDTPHCSGETLDPEFILGDDAQCESAPSCWRQ